MIKLIAFVDGSNYSKSVCDHAAWVATKLGGSVDLIHVRGRRNDSGAPVDFSGSIGLGARSALLEELAEQDGQIAKLDHKRGRAILDDAKETLLAAGVNQVSTLLRNDGIVETVQEFESGAGLIVIGKRGKKTESDESHLGSNFERVVRASHKPVLVASQSFKPINRLLIAFDGGPSANKAVDYLAGKQVFGYRSGNHRFPETAPPVRIGDGLLDPHAITASKFRKSTVSRRNICLETSFEHARQQRRGAAASDRDQQRRAIYQRRHDEVA